MEEICNKEKFIKEGVEYSKTDIKSALEFLSTNTTKNYKSDNTGEEYSILYKNNRYAIKLIYEQMRIAKGLEYENKITATSIKTSFSAYYEILPCIWNNVNPGSKKNILENLKKEFKSYLNNLYPNGYDKTYEYDPFYLINDRSTDIKDFCKENNIYFWKIFENDDNLEKYYQVLKENRSPNTYNSYMSSTNRLKDFFNQKYGGYINWLRTLSETDNQEINFELIEDWAINYLGKYHSAGDSDSGTKGRKVIEEFKKLGNAVVSKFSDYTLSYCTSWQNSGKIYPYLWIQFKHKNWQDSPCSISMFVIKENDKAKLCIETEIDDKNAKSKDYENFLKTLNTTFAYDNHYYWEDENATKFRNIESALASVAKGDSKKIKTIKLINSPYISAESSRIINELQAGFENLISRYESIFESKSQQKESIMNIPLNQILYGPPGTGKTYNTVLKAMSIIYNTEYKDVSDEQYKALKTRFDELKQAGQIEFVTFHQSYSYEEFVEGIKPYLDSESWDEPVEKLTYQGTNGLFKTISNLALFERLNITNQEQEAVTDFKHVKNLFIEEYEIGSTFKTKTKETEFRIDKYTDKSARITPINGKYTYSITFKYLEEAFSKDMKTQDEIAKINGVASGLSCYYYSIYEKLLEIKKSNNKNLNQNKKLTNNEKLQLVKDYYDGKITLKNNDKSKPYVLIIDEINRGNISKIFGELITLIEEDKRENLTLTLPYSKEPFTVPKNLHILGTMNTSDRSIASIDIALRRRFKFKEMMPKADLVADFNCNFHVYFAVMNERISALLDRDHQIGHSYFIKNTHQNDGIDELKDIWFDSILPLLNEYFYSDWEKLQALLGPAKVDNTSFIKKIEKITFANNYTCEDDENYDFVNFDDCNFIEAMKNAFGDSFEVK